mmetsp:Transcript_6110/g.9489  ORF Transcript_6110/g.9489 Transcript_6110/m.9489 type:complete len:95 (-) Transcript_6110:347-631(-)
MAYIDQLHTSISEIEIGNGNGSLCEEAIWNLCEEVTLSLCEEVTWSHGDLCYENESDCESDGDLCYESESESESGDDDLCYGFDRDRDRRHHHH